MSDERIERLTEIARRVWPKHNLRVVQVTGYGHGWRVMAWDAQGHNPIVLLHVEQHDLSLDALEAALAVLAGREPDCVRELRKHIHGIEKARRLEKENLHKRIEWAEAQLKEPPAWVEQLASEWERRADQISVWPENECNTFLECAAELRERAKKVTR